MPSSEPHGVHRKRYAAKVEKGENVWKTEWNSFISGLTLKRVRDGSIGIALRTADDLQQKTQESPASGSSPSSRPRQDKGASSWNESQEDNPDARGFTFSYLFNSPADRKIARETKQKQRAQAKGDRSGAENSHHTSKHQQALLECKARGLNVEGMTRKEVRSFLNLTRTKEYEEAEQRAKEFKLHHLLDEKLAWYQQGPSPIDLISENLVTRKAEKKGKRLGLRYNYLLPHPSWVARRAQRRRESILVGLGRRFVFDEDTGVAMDPLRNIPVDLTKVKLTFGNASMPIGGIDANAGMEGQSSVDEEAEAHPEDTSSESNKTAEESISKKGKRKGTREAPITESAPDVSSHSSIRLDDDILVNPFVSRNSLTRAVVRSRSAAEAIQKANLTTNYISSKLLGGTNAAGA
ncbi:unnamed protein product [Phytomonas sp. EM1]|nr:unnamed protein product [Phytomonas sp. EM1]|eukprot:CCW61856.1 unnamed protein product [Phytomonas sp. isolate EM1]